MTSAHMGVTDFHIHVQPFWQMKPEIRDVMWRGKDEQRDEIDALARDPRLLLAMLDERGIERVGLVNYPSPDLMGFTDETNQFAAEYASAAPNRLLPFGGVHPRFTKDPEAQVEELLQLGIRCLKIHPPHQLFPANAYTMGLEALGRIYRRAEERGLPIMIHTGTSIFPGARCKYGKPMELDDVAIDFPDLTIIMAHGGRPLWMDEAFFILRRHRNVLLELSGIPPKKLLDYFPRLSELDGRVIWGSDWPSPGVKDLRENLDQFRSLPLSDELKHQITCTTSHSVVPSL